MGNTEGSQTDIRQILIRRNIHISLSHDELSIIIGSILGDAYVYPLGKICFEQSSKQSDYLNWKYSLLKRLAYPKIAIVSRLDRRNGVVSESKRFFLRQYFRKFRELFYPDGKKTIPIQILEKWLTPLSLAIWYMDDGHLEKHKYPTIATESYRLEDLDKVISLLKDKFKLDCLLNKKKKRLRIRSNSVNQFFDLIFEYMPECMKYKSLDPVTTRSRLRRVKMGRVIYSITRRPLTRKRRVMV